MNSTDEKELRLQTAINYYLDQAATSPEYDVSASTLYARLRNGNRTIATAARCRRKLTEEEEQEVFDESEDRHAIGETMTVPEICELATEFYNDRGLDGELSQSWYNGFKRRFPLVKTKRKNPWVVVPVANYSAEFVRELVMRESALLASIYGDEDGVRQPSKPATRKRAAATAALRAPPRKAPRQALTPRSLPKRANPARRARK
ncbi:hypothetical protein PYCC9005_005712 [Savitreella phatthalungensis]